MHPLLSSVTRIAFGPDDIIAAASGRTLLFVCARTKRCLEAVESAHEDPIDALAWAPSKEGGREAVLASGGRDRQVRFWHAPPKLQQSGGA